jgi:hypothetical protein
MIFNDIMKCIRLHGGSILTIYYCVLCNEMHEKDDPATMFLTGFRASLSAEMSSVGICKNDIDIVAVKEESMFDTVV